MNGAISTRSKLSNSDVAIRLRSKYLTNDKYANGEIIRKRRHAAKKKANIVLSDAGHKASMIKPYGPTWKRIEYHLSKGRDAGDIAVRESLKVSAVQSIIDQVQAHLTKAKAEQG